MHQELSGWRGTSGQIGYIDHQYWGTEDTRNAIQDQLCPRTGEFLSPPCDVVHVKERGGGGTYSSPSRTGRV